MLKSNSCDCYTFLKRSINTIGYCMLIILQKHVASETISLLFLFFKVISGHTAQQLMTARQPKLCRFVSLSLPLSLQSISRCKSDQLWHMVHLQLPHCHHHAGPHLAVAALPFPRLQVSVHEGCGVCCTICNLQFRYLFC